MITRDFKDIRLSALGMGNMRLPVVQGGGDGDIDLERGKEIIDRAMKNGVNYYDTAYIYHSGKSEGFLKEALVKRYPRDSFYIADKFFIQANPDYKAVFEEQLERLGTDYIDFYLIHSVG
ncbi:MAG: aldo/keto reductase, partial [Oscillospiraceae bacterium]|nr:aldo/keto reductase [Oscillospiraceae bacterium]